MLGKLIVNKSYTRGSGPEFPVKNFVAVLATAYELAGKEFRDIFSDMDSVPFDSAILIPALMEYEETLTSVLNKGSTVDVRFLGDLKEHSYSPDVAFFSATKDAGDDFSKTLRDSLSSLRKNGGGKAVLVNLANVREVTVTVGLDISPQFAKNLECTMDTLKVLHAWGLAGDRIQVIEVN